MQIHEVIKTVRFEHKIDPVMGHVTVPVEVLQRGSTWRISAAGESFERAADGSFDLPDGLAAQYVAGPSWFEGPSPFEPEPEPEAVPERKPFVPQFVRSASTASDDDE